MADGQELFRNALAALNNRNLPEAESLFRLVLRLDKSHVPSLNLLTIVLMSMGRFAEAEEFVARAVELNQNSDVSFYNYGLILKQLKRPHRALEQLNKALQLNQSVAETWNARGALFNELKKYDSAVSDFDRAIELNNGYADAYSNKGKSLSALKSYDAAFAAFDKALALKPGLAEAWLGRANILVDLKRYEDALAAFEHALGLKSDLAEAWLGRGNVLVDLSRDEEALAAFGKALELKADLAEAWAGHGNVFVHLKKYEQALAAFDKALALDPDFAEAWFGRGMVFNAQRDHEKAIAAYANALKLNPDRSFLKGLLLHQQMLCCDWENFEAQVSDIEKDIDSGKAAAEPFGWQGLATTEQSLQQCARIYNANSYPAKSLKRPSSFLIRTGAKIRIGYVSGEFREQATSYLIVGVLENHDKSAFEIFGFDNGWDDGSPMRQRIVKTLHALEPIRSLSNASAADLIRKAQIDILVNLNGYFGEERTAVFAQIPAPIQVNYLGFPGTLGASYIDYIIADQCVIPPERKQFYEEKVVYLPWCYQANDSRKPIGQGVASRTDSGLPQNAFVFCCFNNNYKITPSVFDAWMRILRRIDGAVLWLLSGNAAVEANLRNQAGARGIDPNRLVFAKLLPLSDHLARLPLADLFLDTLPYNAHTTASDALWAGLPVLTRIGDTFAGRVAASLLQAIELPELITRSQEEYEDLALALAENREALHSIKQKLVKNRLGAPLFNTELFTRHIELGYQAMYQRYKAGLPPDHIRVEAITKAI